MMEHGCTLAAADKRWSTSSLARLRERLCGSPGGDLRRREEQGLRKRMQHHPAAERMLAGLAAVESGFPDRPHVEQPPRACCRTSPPAGGPASLAKLNAVRSAVPPDKPARRSRLRTLTTPPVTTLRQRVSEPRRCPRASTGSPAVKAISPGGGRRMCARGDSMDAVTGPQYRPPATRSRGATRERFPATTSDELMGPGVSTRSGNAGRARVRGYATGIRCTSPIRGPSQQGRPQRRAGTSDAPGRGGHR